MTDYVEIPDSCTSIMYYGNITDSYNINGANRTFIVNFYDASKNQLSYITQKDYELTAVDVPNGAKYIRINCHYPGDITSYWIWDEANDECLWPTRTVEQ